MSLENVLVTQVLMLLILSQGVLKALIVTKNLKLLRMFNLTISLKLILKNV